MDSLEMTRSDCSKAASRSASSLASPSSLSKKMKVTPFFMTSHTGGFAEEDDGAVNARVRVSPPSHDMRTLSASSEFSTSPLMSSTFVTCRLACAWSWRSVQAWATRTCNMVNRMAAMNGFGGVNGATPKSARPKPLPVASAEIPSTSSTSRYSFCTGRARQSSRGPPVLSADVPAGRPLSPPSVASPPTPCDALSVEAPAVSVLLKSMLQRGTAVPCVRAAPSATRGQAATRGGTAKQTAKDV
mmetsp:Transcript_34282/g.99573  ORF Transcript_34282/g.99573 Transcript_34282/m.99573 type:complete len:244 (-) Transcript_34282:169-900(-)